MRLPLFALPLLFLAACATPLERCVSQATQSFRAAEAELRDLEATLARGYAIEPRPRTRTSYGAFCYDRDSKTRYGCFRDRTVIVPTRVRVNLSEVRRRAGDLRARLPALQRSADAGARQCRETYPLPE